LLYNLAVINHVLRDHHRALFLAEIVRKNYGESPERFPELDQISYPCGYRAAVLNNAATYGLDPFFVFAVIRQESKFDIEAHSDKAAQGLMQITPETGRWLCLRMKLDYREGMLADPETNIRLGCWYLKYLGDKFVDPASRREWVLAAYNAGLGNAERWMRRWKARNKKGAVVDYVPYRETKDYISRVLDAWQTYRRLHGGKTR